MASLLVLVCLGLVCVASWSLFSRVRGCWLLSGFTCCSSVLVSGWVSGNVFWGSLGSPDVPMASREMVF